MTLATENIARIALSVIGGTVSANSTSSVSSVSRTSTTNGANSAISTPSYQGFLTELGDYDMVVSNVFQGWCGIDSKVAFIAIYLSYCQAREDATKKNTRIIFTSRFANTEKVKQFLECVYRLYEQACGEVGLKFIPSIPGALTKICIRAIR